MQSWSNYQLDIFKAHRDEICDMLIQAVAGSGKTTTIVELAKRAKGKKLFLAFANSIVDALQEKVGSKVTVSTLHSLGMQCLVQKFRKLNVNEFKTGKFISKRIKDWGVLSEDYAMTFTAVSKLVEIYRMTMCSSIEELKINADNIGIFYEQDHLKYCLEILGLLERYNRNPQEVDFTDMIYLPATMKNVWIPEYNHIFVDECQDLNNAQHKFVEKLSLNARIVYVGDQNQAIFGFAGANVHSFDRILERPNIKQFPLSICYRCGKRIAANANSVKNVLESPKWIHEGDVRLGDIDEALPGDLIICRNLKPLLKAYFSLIADERKVKIRGVEIGKSLITVLSRYKGKPLNSLYEGMERELLDLEDKLRARGIKIPKKHITHDNLSQKFGAIVTISVNFTSVNEMIQSLKRIFSDKEDSKTITLCTIHKAKGLEANNVFLLDSFLIGKKATTDQQIEQERNLRYVAYSRAIHQHIYVMSSDI